MTYTQQLYEHMKSFNHAYTLEYTRAIYGFIAGAMTIKEAHMFFSNQDQLDQDMTYTQMSKEE